MLQERNRAALDYQSELDLKKRFDEEFDKWMNLTSSNLPLNAKLRLTPHAELHVSNFKELHMNLLLNLLLTLHKKPMRNFMRNPM